MATETGFDKQVWRQMSDQLGLQSLAIPEAYGGSGFGFVELSLVLEEMGRALLRAPFFSTVVLAAHALLHSGDERAKANLLPGIATGETIATVAQPAGVGEADEAALGVVVAA
jgi:alkylation response protein AidB-like acyl-CoA dehydrogenase